MLTKPVVLLSTALVMLAISVILTIMTAIALSNDGNGAQVTAKQTATTATAPGGSVSNGCRVINDYPLELLPEVATSGSHIHVEYWWDGSGGERETLLPTEGVDGGRFILNRALKGHVWEYAGCADDEVLDQINVHIGRRLAGHADNKGYVEWKSTELFNPAGGQGRPGPLAALSQALVPQASLPDRTDCNAIRGTAYRSPAEREFFLANCQSAQTQQPVSEPAAASNCDSATAKETHPPVVGQGWIPSGEWRVLGFWTNEPEKDQAERKLLLTPADNVSLLGGGTSWSWPAACEQAARDEFSTNGLPATSLAELRSQGLIR